MKTESEIKHEIDRCLSLYFKMMAGENYIAANVYKHKLDAYRWVIRDMRIN